MKIEKINLNLDLNLKRKYPFAIYDLSNEIDGNIFFSPYQSKKLYKLNLLGNIEVVPLYVDYCHSIYIKDKKLYASCFRKKNIFIFDLVKLKIIKNIKFKSFYPISSILLNGELISIDYLNSKLYKINLNTYKKEDISDLLFKHKRPHSIKNFQNLNCICTRNPSVLILLENMSPILIYELPSNLDIMSAFPLGKKYILITCINNGIYSLDVQYKILKQITNKIPSPTSLTLMDSDLFISSETEPYIFRVSKW